jgi:hypothetical protein
MTYTHAQHTIITSLYMSSSYLSFVLHLNTRIRNVSLLLFASLHHCSVLMDVLAADTVTVETRQSFRVTAGYEEDMIGYACGAQTAMEAWLAEPSVMQALHVTGVSLLLSVSVCLSMSFSTLYSIVIIVLSLHHHYKINTYMST